MPREIRSRQCFLAAQSLAVVRQSWRCAGGAGQFAGRADLLSSEPCHQERLATSDPGNAGWQSDLSASYTNVGDVQVAQGNLPAALTSYQAGLAIRERLAKSDPGNAGWQHNLSVSYKKVGDTYGKAGQLTKAREAFAAGRAIIAQLVAQHPDWVEWKKDLAWFDQQIDAHEK